MDNNISVPHDLPEGNCNCYLASFKIMHYDFNNVCIRQIYVELDQIYLLVLYAVNMSTVLQWLISLMNRIFNLIYV